MVVVAAVVVVVVRAYSFKLTTFITARSSVGAVEVVEMAGGSVEGADGDPLAVTCETWWR